MRSKVKQVIVVRRDLQMRKGKVGAQVAHAAISFLSAQIRQHLVDTEDIPRPAIYLPYESVQVRLSEAEKEWLTDSFTKVVVGVDNEKELWDLVLAGRNAGVKVHPFHDSGFTEFHGQETLTCAAFGPDYTENLDPITGHLRLL